MGEKIVIGIVVIVVIVAHGWIFIWVRFKIDEGAILKYLQAHEGQQYPGSEVIASNTNLTNKRVCIVCRKSKELQRSVR